LDLSKSQEDWCGIRSNTKRVGRESGKHRTSKAKARVAAQAGDKVGRGGQGGSQSCPIERKLQ